MRPVAIPTWYAYRADPQTGWLSLLNSRSVGGNSTLCLGLSGDGKHLVVGSISGHVACIRVEEDGRLGEVCDDFALPGEAGPLREAQPWPRAHHSVFDTDGTLCYIVDKGKDTVDTYRVMPKAVIWIAWPSFRLGRDPVPGILCSIPTAGLRISIRSISGPC